MSYKIGIICAGDREVAPFIPLIEECSISEKAMLKFYSGKIAGIQIVTLYCGVCKTNAAIATQILIDNYNCNIIINAGTAGGVDPKVDLFDIIVSTEVAHWDVNEGILTEFHPWMDSIYFKADSKLIDYSKRVVDSKFSSKVYFGRMITGESFIKEEFREMIKLKYCPLSIDMETASIAHACYVNKIPYIAIRSITDTARHSGADAFDLNCDKASNIAASFVVELLKEIAKELK